MLIIVAAALINTQGKVLIQQRPHHKTHGGLWEFPGGKREAGETPEVALRRELHEELGIEVALHDMQPCHFVTHPFHHNILLYPTTQNSTMPATDNQMFLLLLYRVQQWQGLIEAKEQQPMRWVNAQEIQHYAMPPADIPLLDFIWHAQHAELHSRKTEVA
jgi:8-oxo-dGTP diphosphatase